MMEYSTRKFFLLAVAVFPLSFAGCAGLVTPKEAVTTNIRDAHVVASWLDYYTDIGAPEQSSSFDIAPGYYTFDVQSYCLKAGKYAPTAGAGYLIAPLKGERAVIIRNILSRSEGRPDVPQRDIQRLLWGIETGANFRKYSPAFQARVAPLLTPVEIVALSVDPEEFLEAFLPSGIKKTLKVYDRLREKVTDVNATYEEIERTAVLFGVAPLGPGSRDIGPGAWAYVGDGFYLRAFPMGYQQSRIEVIRPAPYSLVRDDKGRIAEFRSGNFRIETSYDDSLGRDVVSAPGKPDIRIWRFKSIRLIGPALDDELVIRDQGWVLASSNQLAGDTMPGSHQSSGIQVASTASNWLRLAQDDGIIPEEWKKAKERWDRAEKIKDFIEDVDDYYEEQVRAERPPSEEAIDDITDLDHYREGLETAIDPTDFEGRSDWIREHFTRLIDVWLYASCVLAGDCAPPGAQPAENDPDWDDLETFDPAGSVATPANTSGQRIGLSRRP